jgi:Sugar kinases, ribokinase family
MKKVFCFGELLLRLSPELNRQWIQHSSLPVYIGGAELNVASALAKWNIPTKYSTALPDNYLSKEIIQELNQRAIDTSAIHLSGKRIGLYYLSEGADLKSSGVIYDRDYSSFSFLKPGMINWQEVLKDCDWFHFSAISPALNANTATVCEEALKVAQSRNMTISVDLNYREKLWQYGTKPIDVIPALVKYCQVVMGNIWSVENLLGLPSDIKESNGKTMDQLSIAAANSMKQVHHHYPNVSTIGYTFRLEKTYFGILAQGASITPSKLFSLNQVIDRVGSGDCFMSGLIYGLLHKHSPQSIIDFAVAAAIGKLYEKGDATNNKVEQIQTILSKHE